MEEIRKVYEDFGLCHKADRVCGEKISWIHEWCSEKEGELLSEEKGQCEKVVSPGYDKELCVKKAEEDFSSRTYSCIRGR